MKFKNINKKTSSKKGNKNKTHEHLQFPRNYRIIPEKIKRDDFVFFIGVLIIMIAGLLVSLDLYSNLKEQKNLMVQKNHVLAQRGFWQSQVNSHPNFRDAYFNLALIDYQLKDFSEARLNLDKALTIDPNFEKGRQLEQILNSKY